MVIELVKLTNNMVVVIPDLGVPQRFGDYRTITNGQAGGLLTRTGSFSGHPSKQQPSSMLFDLVILRQPLYPPTVL
ncbi:hypothetical protein J6590_059097 [Homalodisca vitripennis]|nr:hypothetical protein J6590_059097 [Homalodisca vitripennis]